jgi:putative ABC transport system permease protein
MWLELLLLSIRSVWATPLRSALTGLGIAVGVGAVVLLTAIGEGVQRFVLDEFTQFGTNLVAVTPGKTTTFGVSAAAINSVRPLSLEDAEALQRVPGVIATAPALQGNAVVEAGRRTRRTNVYGVNHHAPQIWQFEVAAGTFLPPLRGSLGQPAAVLGSGLYDELFGDAKAVGSFVRIGGERYRVVGVLASKGQFLGFDLDDTVFIPAANALAMFNREGLMEIDLLYRSGVSVDAIVDSVRKLLIDRHGSEDFTIITQTEMLDVLNSVLGVLTLVVGGLGGISLVVGGVGILTIMTIGVRERMSEIGLLRALGAARWQILGLFLFEAALLAALGGAVGMAASVALVELLRVSVDALPAQVAWGYAFGAEGVAIAVGLLAGVIPAMRASRLDPVEALRAE